MKTMHRVMGIIVMLAAAPSVNANAINDLIKVRDDNRVSLEELKKIAVSVSNDKKRQVLMGELDQLIKNNEKLGEIVSSLQSDNPPPLCEIKEAKVKSAHFPDRPAVSGYTVVREGLHLGFFTEFEGALQYARSMDEHGICTLK